MARKKKISKKKKIAAFVLDGSVALAWCFADETDAYADAVARKLPKMQAVVPTIWHLEVTNAMLVGEAEAVRSDRYEELDRVPYLAPLVVDEHIPSRVFGNVMPLAREQTLSTYDAAYLELAMRHSLPLATLDGRLRTAAQALGVPLFDPDLS